MDVKELESIVVRTNAQIERERAAAAAGQWAQLQEERVPAPAIYHLRQRAAWKEALERALAIGGGAEVREALVAPVWFCSNLDDIPGSTWEPATLVAFDDGKFELHERKRVSAIALAIVEHARLGFLVRSRDFAPSVALAMRNEHYGALESRRIERVREITREFGGTDVPIPERDIPPFAIDATPARVADDPAIAERVAAACARVRVFPDGHETLVTPLRR